MSDIYAGTVDDAAEVLQLLQTSFAEYRGKIAPESGVFLRETVETLAVRIASGHLLLQRVQRDETGLIGCVLCEQMGDMLYFGRLAVHPDYRGQGIARRLIAATEQVAIAQGLMQITCYVRIMLPDNVRFFQGLGFSISAEKTHAGFDHPTYYQLIKPLLTDASSNT